ncbi:MAG: hypothetical protein RIQ89_567 [Bacteroidota bacterium]|jgi:hypothetical protein
MDQEQLIKEGYTVSPNSGRLRRKVKLKKQSTPFSKRKMDKLTKKALWVFLILAFIFSVVVILPELVSTSPIEKERQRQLELQKQLKNIR